MAFLITELHFDAHLLKLGSQTIILVLQEQDDFDELVERLLFQLRHIVARLWSYLAFSLVQFFHRLSFVDWSLRLQGTE